MRHRFLISGQLKAHLEEKERTRVVRVARVRRNVKDWKKNG